MKFTSINSLKTTIVILLMSFMYQSVNAQAYSFTLIQNSQYNYTIAAVSNFDSGTFQPIPQSYGFVLVFPDGVTISVDDYFPTGINGTISPISGTDVTFIDPNMADKDLFLITTIVGGQLVYFSPHTVGTIIPLVTLTVIGDPVLGEIRLLDNESTLSSSAPINGALDSFIQVDVIDDGTFMFTNEFNQLTGDINFSFIDETLVYTGGSWNPSAPNSTTQANNALVLDGTYVVSDNVSLNNIIIKPEANTTINSDIILTVNNLTLESTSTTYASIISNGTITGVVNYKRHVNANQTSGGNDLITPPVTGQIFTDFIAQNNNIVSNGNNSLFLFGPFDKTSGDYLTYANTEVAQLRSGIGYRAATTDDGTLNFEGTINQGTVMQNVSNSGPEYSKWNLIGNPYPSYLNVQDFLNNTNNLSMLDETSVGIYGYDGDASDGWVIYNLNTTDNTTVITPGQGFFVAVENDGAIEFTPNMRQHGNTDDFIAGRNANTNQHLRLELSNNTQTYDTDLYFNSNSSSGLDLGYDAATFGNSAGSFAIYSHLVEDNEDIDMAIQSLALDFLSQGIVPLGINANQGEQLTIAIEISSLPETVEVYLEDTVENTFTLLNTSNYVLTPTTTLQGTGRFFIHFSNSTLTNIETELNELNVYTSRASKELIIKGQLNKQAEAKLYDMNGREVLSIMLKTSTNYNAIDIRSFQSGIYILQISDNLYNYKQKVLIN